MKKQLLCVLLLSYCTITQAVSGSQTGAVKELVSVPTHIKSNADYVSLSERSSSVNFSGLGCSQVASDYLFRIPDGARGDKLFTQLLMSKQLNYIVTITVDNVLKDSEGFCFVRELQTLPNETVRYRIK